MGLSISFYGATGKFTHWFPLGVTLGRIRRGSGSCPVSIWYVFCCHVLFFHPNSLMCREQSNVMKLVHALCREFGRLGSYAINERQNSFVTWMTPYLEAANRYPPFPLPRINPAMFALTQLFPHPSTISLDPFEIIASPNHRNLVSAAKAWYRHHLAEIRAEEEASNKRRAEAEAELRRRNALAADEEIVRRRANPSPSSRRQKPKAKKTRTSGPSTSPVTGV